jgi:hypothetical protein
VAPECPKEKSARPTEFAVIPKLDGFFLADYEQGDIDHDLFHAVRTWASNASSQSIAAAPIAAADAILPIRLTAR